MNPVRENVQQSSFLHRAGARIVALFSSVRFGIFLLVVLFFYCSIGSAGILYPDLSAGSMFDLDNWHIIFVRQFRGIELTEFEWFHWWPFDLMIALICLTLTVTTIRRIPLNRINLGVWMIHTGVIVLALGSVWYFSQKIEGDSPIVMRRIVATAPGGKQADIVALPGNATMIETDAGSYRFEVVQTDPNWELLSGPDQGQTTYAVQVRISTPEQTFIRQLLAGYPEFTEDVIPGQGRAIKSTGERLVDETVSVSLAYDPQPYVYLKHTDAIYLREVGSDTWVERPISGVPRYNEYIASYDDVYLPASMGPGGRAAVPISPIGIPVSPASPDDPLPGVTMRVASYLPWAVMQTRLESGGDTLNPYIRVRVLAPGIDETIIELLAGDPTFGGVDPAIASFHWIEDEAALDQLLAPEAGVLNIHVPEADASLTLGTDALDLSSESPEFRAVGESGYAIRVRAVQDHLRAPGTDTVASVVIMDMRTPRGETFSRWVFDDAQLTRDQIRDEATGKLEMIPLNESIITTYQPGEAQSLLTFVGGPSPDRLRVVTATDGMAPSVQEMTPGEATVPLPQLTITVDRFWPHSRPVQKPAVIPIMQRTQNLQMKLRMVEVELPGGEKPLSVWLPFHDYAFESGSAALRGFQHQPTHVTLSDGRTIELLYSRRRLPLPAPVVLADFQVDWHVGGFTGQNTSVKDWRSVVRFVEPDDGLTDPHTVAVNNPADYEGYWFFQSMWDPPDPSNNWNGLNYTVLGVGTRAGVMTQLAGCVLVVIGLCFAFYVKPVLKRRERDRVADAMRARAAQRETSPSDESAAATGDAHAESDDAGTPTQQTVPVEESR